MPRQRIKIERVCGVCQKVFFPKITEVNRGGGKFCSRVCRDHARAAPLEERFRKYVGPTTETGCIPWTGTVEPNGYGVIFSRREEGRHETFMAHRLAWILANGPIPNGLKVLHRCDVRTCVNVEHLILGTQAENMADKVGKGRQTKGSACSLSKLTEEAVRSIRERYARGGVTQKELAEEHQISLSNVYAILVRRSWKHVD